MLPDIAITTIIILKITVTVTVTVTVMITIMIIKRGHRNMITSSIMLLKRVSLSLFLRIVAKVKAKQKVELNQKGNGISTYRGLISTYLGTLFRALE